MIRNILLLLTLSTALGVAYPALSQGAKLNRTEKELSAFLERYVAKVGPLTTADNLAYWEATATGKQEAYDRYEKYELEYKTLHSNREEFMKVWKFIRSGNVRDPLLARQLTLVYNRFASNQVDPALLEKMVKLSTKIEKMFNTHRGLYQGKKVSDNTLIEVLKKETDGAKRREAWEAQKSVAVDVAPLLVELVKLRNTAAKSLGYTDYYEMELTLDEQGVDEVGRIFDELAKLTDTPFRKMKAQIDTSLAARWGVKPAQMRPWHYQDFFFQETPDLGAVNLDAIFEKHDCKTLVADFYRNINLNVDPVLERSDLYEREGKYQHAYCNDMDRNGDVRTMCNLRNNEQWVGTLLHELGHGVYSYYHDRTLPWLLRDSAHTFTTEAIAQMFERCVTNPEWLVKVAGADPGEIDKVKGALAANQRMGQLVFCRWSMVMLHFERELYRDPDQDLDARWWGLVEKYQLVTRPEGRKRPDWAAKIHLTSSPVYYHNYLLGQILASQLLDTMATKVLKSGKGRDVSFVSRPELGAYLVSQVFYPGSRYRWDEMIRRATFEDLTPKYYVKDFVEE